MSTATLKPKEMIFLTYSMRADLRSHNNSNLNLHPTPLFYQREYSHTKSMAGLSEATQRVSGRAVTRMMVS